MIILRAFRTSHTESCITLAGLTPLDYRIIELTTIRFLEFENKKNFSKSAARVAAKVISVTSLNVPYDRAKCVHLPESPPWLRLHPLTILTSSSDSTISASLPTTRIFTDGSIGKNGAGFSAIIFPAPNLQHSLAGSLPHHTSIFQAEGYAILAALNWIVSTRPLPGQIYEIISDSKSALAASTPSASAKSSEPFSSIIKILSVYNDNIKLYWTPSHSGNPGNEMADSLAKSVAIRWSSQNPLLPMTKTYAKEVIHNHISSLWEVEWQSLKSGTSTRSFFPSIASSKILNTLTLSYQTYQLLTGHCRLNAYQYRFKHISSPLCSCLSEIESIDHFLLRCPIFSTHRVPLIHSVLSLNRIWPPDLHVLTQSKQLLIALNNFTVDTNRLNTIQTNTQHNTRQM